MRNQLLLFSPLNLSVDVILKVSAHIRDRLFSERKRLLSRLSVTFYRFSLALMVLLASSMASAQSSESSDSDDDAQVVRVNLTGLSDELERNVRVRTTLFSLDGEPAPASFRLRFLQRRAEAEIREALMPFGYYQPTIDSTLEETPSAWTIQFDVDAGQPVMVETVDITITGIAQTDEKFIELQQKLPIRQGTVFRHQDYERAKGLLRNLAAERGYYDAKLLTNKVAVELADQTAHVELVLDSGPRYHYGDIEFCCAHIGDELLQRYVQFESGDPFSTSELLNLQLGLSSSNYFETIEIAPNWSERKDATVPVAVTMTPNQRDYYQTGLGYGTDTGARVTLGFDRRWVNDRGHRINSILRLSEVQNTGSVSYIIPGFYPPTDQYDITGEVTDRSYLEQRSTLYKLAARDIRHFDDWQRTWQLSWQRESFAFGDQPRRSSQFLIPAAEFSLIRSTNNGNNRNLIDDGYRVSLSLQGASADILADTTFLSAKLSAKWVHRLNQQWRILARGEIGAIETDDFELLSPTLRFFAGGDYSVRGYAFQDLGPRNEEDVVVGGRYLVTSSLEVDYQINDAWRVAAFTDIGNAMMEWDTALKQSVGVGIRWLSPIGPVRFDVAQAIDEPGNPWRIHFTLGPDL